MLNEILQRITKLKSSDNPILSKEATSIFSALNEFIALQKEREEKQLKSDVGVDKLYKVNEKIIVSSEPAKSSKSFIDKIAQRSKIEIKPINQSVKFLAFHPTAIKEEELSSLLVYIFVENSEMIVRKDARERLSKVKSIYASGIGAANTSIKQGAQVGVLPKLPGISFNPRSITIEWEDDWHAAEFRMKVDEKNPPAIFESPIYGSVEFWVGPLCIGQAPIWLAIIREDIEEAKYNIPSESIANMFHSIFPSYAREDSEFIEHLEKAYSLINLQYFRDVSTLRAGEEWKPRIKELINEANIFQLCWSKAAALSKYVADEYLYALQLNRTEFIKPIYWEIPMPEVPGILSHLHFQQWKEIL